MTKSRTPFAVVALRILAVAFAIGVVVWLAIDKQRRANPPDPAAAPTGDRSSTGPANVVESPASPYLNSSKSITVDAESLPILRAPTDGKPTDGKPAEGATFLPSSKSGRIEPPR